MSISKLGSGTTEAELGRLFSLLKKTTGEDDAERVCARR